MEETLKDPLPYRVLIKLDLDFDTRSDQDVPLPRPGDVISAGFTEFKGYDPTKYIIMAEERGKHTVRVTKTQDLEFYDHWNGVDFEKKTQSKIEIGERKSNSRKAAKAILDGPIVTIDTSNFAKVSDLNDFLKLSTVLGLKIDVPESSFKNEQFLKSFLVIKIDSRDFYVPAYTRRV